MALNTSGSSSVSGADKMSQCSATSAAATATSSSSNTAASSVHGESHRVYWQQWLSNNETSTGSRREWITSSVAVRMTPEARARDVTNLLRGSLKLASTTETQDDALILVGTLYSLSSDFCQYQHEPRDSSGNPSSRTCGLVQLKAHQVQSNSTTSSKATIASLMSNRKAMALSPIRNKTLSSSPNSPTSPARGMQLEPIHLIHTLAPTESPLKIRHRMEERIQELTSDTSNQGRGRTIMAPQIQWYFIPTLAADTCLTQQQQPQQQQQQQPNASIPNCLQLEGYCTSMEEESDTDQDDEHDDMEDDTDRQGHGNLLGASPSYDDDEGDRNSALISNWYDEEKSEQERMEERFPWLKERGKVNSLDNDTNANTRVLDTTTALRRKQRIQRKMAKERKRANEMLACQNSSTQQQSQLSGFLLKRCTRDRHVWRRVHCILTNDYLWFLTRMYTCQGNADSFAEPEYRYCHHGRLRLTRALLLEPAMDYAPLYRTPYAFELVTPDGASHAFRATSKQIQLQWIRVLSERIVQSYENSLLEQAEWILVDQCVARSKRLQAFLDARSMIEQAQANATTLEKGLDETDKKRRHSLPEAQFIRAPCFLQWAVQVAEYRECGRYVQSLLPPKNPVVVTSPDNTTKVARHPSPTTQARQTIAALSLVPSETPLDPQLRQWIRQLWAQASHLLAITSAGPSASYVVSRKLSVDKGLDEKQQTFVYPRRIETLFRHIEYMITGSHNRHQNSRSPDASAAALAHHQTLPPPLDLFDPLLRELATLVVTNDTV